MQYYRCKCGESESWGSIGPRQCDRCEKCGTTLNQSPEGHKEPEPHEWVTQYNERTGKPYEICINCMKKKPVEG